MGCVLLAEDVAAQNGRKDGGDWMNTPFFSERHSERNWKKVEFVAWWPERLATRCAERGCRLKARATRCASAATCWLAQTVIFCYSGDIIHPS